MHTPDVLRVASSRIAWFFCFKQKTAYEMRISDWSSDVCSSDLPADRDRLSIRFGATQVASGGLAVEGYDEAPVAAHLKGQDIAIGVDLGLGDGRTTVWTCDRSEEHTSELQSLMRISYAVFCLKTKNRNTNPLSRRRKNVARPLKLGNTNHRTPHTPKLLRCQI